MGSRQIGMGLGPIGWTVIQSYCDAYGISGEQAAAMHHHIKKLDEAYLNFQGK